MEKAQTLALNFQTWAGQARGCCLLLALAVLFACSSGSPEEALRARMTEMQTAASERRVGDFMNGVADDFSGNGGMDRAALHNMLRMQMLGKTRVGIASGPLRVDILGETATVKFDAVMTGGSGGLLPDSGQAYSITSGWRLHDGEWQLYYADWRSRL